MYSAKKRTSELTHMLVMRGETADVAYATSFADQRHFPMAFPKCLWRNAASLSVSISIA
jgi:hypothetical protein